MGGLEDTGIPAGTLYTVKSDAETGIVRPGFLFAGWNTRPDGSGTAYKPGDIIPIAGDVALYAQWTPEPPNFFGVTYLPNGGTGGFEDNGIPAGTLYTVKSDVETGIVRPGFLFAGWNTRPDGSGTAYKPGDVIPIAGDVALYAQWVYQPPTYTVTYLANGGTGGSTDAGILSGSSYVIKSGAAAGVSRPSYNFLRWNTRADGLGSSYLPGQVITVTGDLLLYAQWYLIT